MRLNLFLLVVFVTNESFGTRDTANYYLDYGEYSDDYYSQPPSKREDKLQCFSCIYIIEGKSVQGSSNCDDPFQYEPDTINYVSCNNGSCAKIYLRLDNKYSMVHRSCMANCINSKTSLGYSECCDRNFCNDSRHLSGTFWLTLANVVCVSWVFLIFSS